VNITVAETNLGAPTIELYHFRWHTFPLNVLVDLNEWSADEYALAVRGAIDRWVTSIWNYTHTYTNLTLALTYRFYVSTVNATDSYDILITFTQNEIDRNNVGLTTFRWNARTHEPITPFNITITSYAATADPTFITNIATHELGHALGLGHTDSQFTTNGPELMYPTSSHEQMVYPSTLNLYGLSRLYRGTFAKIVSLPSTIPYLMVAPDRLPPPNPIVANNMLSVLINDMEAFFRNPQGIRYQPTRLLVPSLVWMAIALILGLLLRSTTKATMGAAGVFIIAYYIAMVKRDVSLVGLALGLLFPSLVIGAFIGGAIRTRVRRA
jgi:predicted Zn-dependent protease